MIKPLCLASGILCLVRGEVLTFLHGGLGTFLKELTSLILFSSGSTGLCQQEPFYVSFPVFSFFLPYTRRSAVYSGQPSSASQAITSLHMQSLRSTSSPWMILNQGTLSHSSVSLCEQPLTRIWPLRRSPCTLGMGQYSGSHCLCRHTLNFLFF